jgi:tRNA A37 threonylcarbamoyladenosine biosynthesis protein TsaE
VRSFETKSEEETIELGRTIARELPRKAVVLLIGNLGAGKTTLAECITWTYTAWTPPGR